MTADEALLVAALDKIEQREARLLAWGLVDGFLTSAEAAEIVDSLLDDPRFADEAYKQPLSFVSAAGVIETLKARALLLDMGEGAEPRYRSRMAEAVRLTFRVRQLFPKHQGPTGWQSAPTLVADFRFIWRRRRYPDRCIAPQDALDQIGAAAADAYARDALAELIRSHGSQFKLARFQLEASQKILAAFGAREWQDARFLSPRAHSGRRARPARRRDEPVGEGAGGLSAQRTAQGPVRRGLRRSAAARRLAAGSRAAQVAHRRFL